MHTKRIASQLSWSGEQIFFLFIVPTNIETQKQKEKKGKCFYYKI